MTERLEPLKLKRRIIKALARWSPGFSESLSFFFLFSPTHTPVHLLFPSFFPRRSFSCLFTPVFWPFPLSLSLSLVFLFLHPFSLSFPPHVRGESCASLQLAFCFPRLCRDFKTQECDRVQPNLGVAPRSTKTVPF